MDIKQIGKKRFENIKKNWRSNWLYALILLVIITDIFFKCPKSKFGTIISWIFYPIAVIAVIYKINWEIKKRKKS